MCIIITKERNAKPLPEEIFDIIWTNNPDGGGILYNNGKETILKKGLMKREEFLKAAKEVNKKGISYIMHTRIATHGSVKPENTHPFVSRYLGFAHNGTFNVEPFPDKTDSETFFMAAIGNKKYKWCEENKFLLDMATNGCRCAIMDLETGKIMHLCEEDWKMDKKYKGYRFSNTSYMQVTRYLYSSKTGTSYMGKSYGSYGRDYCSPYDKSYEWEDDLDDWDQEDKYGKISKKDKEEKIIDKIHIEQFKKKDGKGLLADKDWAKTYLQSFTEYSNDEKDKQEMNNTLTMIGREYADILAYEGVNTYEALSAGFILNYVSYASALGYNKPKEVLTSLKEMVEVMITATEEEKQLVEEIKLQLEEWMA